MMTNEFEWDQNKAIANLNKHGISFGEAKTVFDDHLSIIFDDPTHSIGENRFLIIGYSNCQRLIIVVYTERKNKVRIISARNVTSHEKRIYEQDNLY